MTSKIEFINISAFKQEHVPESSSKYIPDWYKETSSYFIENGKNFKKKQAFSRNFKTVESYATIKKCLPIFDSMTAGYIIPISEDITVNKISINNEKLTQFNWTSNGSVSSHPMIQVGKYPHNSIHKINLPKFISNWTIKTEPGYSCLFLPPMHRESCFSVLPAIVDTDTFDFPISFPFTMTDPNFEGTIEAGTPMVQVIPFKRDEWSMEYEVNHRSASTHPDFLKLRTKMFDGYKSIFWSKKEYK
jgi:hypothetical protein